jgi:hypothetical protein
MKPLDPSVGIPIAGKVAVLMSPGEDLKSEIC